MKKCNHCNDGVLYDNIKVDCPVCGRRLSDYSPQKPRIEDVRATGTISLMSTIDEESYSDQVFETVSGNTHFLTGTVSEVTSNARANNRLKKIVNVVCNGEPYQFGHTSHETVIRIEEIANTRHSVEKRDVYLYGDIEGRVFPGDYIALTAREYRNRLVAESFESLETNTTTRPQGQIPHGVAAVFIFVICLLMVMLIGLFVWLLASGKIINVITAIVGGVFGIILSIIFSIAPLLLVIWVLLKMFR